MKIILIVFFISGLYCISNEQQQCFNETGTDPYSLCREAELLIISGSGAKFDEDFMFYRCLYKYLEHQGCRDKPTNDPEFVTPI